MTDVVVNESRFVVDMSDEIKDHALRGGMVLPDGQVVGDQIDRSDAFQIYDTRDGSFILLVTGRELASRWIAEGFLPERAFGRFTGEDGKELWVLYSPTSLILQRVTACRAYGSLRYALAFAAALFKARILDHGVNLRDGIFCELYGVILPAYTKTRAVADRALFENVLSRSERENLSSPDEMGKSHGLNRFSLKEELREASLTLAPVEPYLENGEILDDFIEGAGGLYATGYLVLDEQYQIYDTGSDTLVLLMENRFAGSLVERGLIREMELSAISVGGLYLRALALSKRFALERVNDRHFGLTAAGAFKFASAVARTRARVPDASLEDALYSEELGLLLPVRFEGDGSQDGALVREVVSVGPFAMAPFLEDVIEHCALIASHPVI